LEKAATTFSEDPAKKHRFIIIISSENVKDYFSLLVERYDLYLKRCPFCAYQQLLGWCNPMSTKLSDSILLRRSPGEIDKNESRRNITHHPSVDSRNDTLFSDGLNLFFYQHASAKISVQNF